MRENARKVGRLVFAVLVVSALGFGAVQALSATAQRECSLCDYPDPQGLCNTCCIEVLGFEGGDCWPSGNCLCY
jgi:hypothetical protein